MAWKPGQSPVGHGVQTPPTPTRSPKAEVLATPGITAPSPLIKARDIATGGISISTQIANTVAPWKPVLQFGGSSTGITYSVQKGFVCSLGKIIIAHFGIQLSSKGSATGSATLGGLPVNSLDTDEPITLSQSSAPVTYSGINPLVSNPNAVLVVDMLPKSNTAIFAWIGGGLGSNVTSSDADFQNGTVLGGTISYISQ